METVAVGRLTLTVLDDGACRFPAREFFSNVDEAMWRAEACADAEGKILVGHNCALVASCGQLIVIDTGYGDDTHGGQTGHMLAELKKAGYRRDQAGIVVLTHAHGDHNGRNTLAAGEPAFPHATYFLGRADWDWFSGPQGEVHHFDRNLRSIAEAGLLRLFDGAVQLTPEVYLLPTPGHTPGHASVVMESGGRMAIYLGDLCHHPLHFAHPEWVSSFDTNPGLTPRTRERVFRMAVEMDALVVCPHAPYPGLGRVRRSGSGYVWEPAPVGQPGG